MLKGSEVLPLNCTVSCMLPWKDPTKFCNLGGQPIFQDFEEALSDDEVERLGQIDDGDVQGHLLFSALLLKLAEGDDHVYC